MNQQAKRRRKDSAYRKAKGRCYYCGRVGKYVDMTLDHVIPRSAGGPDHPNNLKLACAGCNAAKGSSPSWEFVAGRETFEAHMFDALDGWVRHSIIAAAVENPHRETVNVIADKQANPYIKQ